MSTAHQHIVGEDESFSLKKASAFQSRIRLWQTIALLEIYANASTRKGSSVEWPPLGLLWESFSMLAAITCHAPLGSDVLKLMTETAELKSEQLKSHNSCIIKASDYECLICHVKELCWGAENWISSSESFCRDGFPLKFGEGMGRKMISYLSWGCSAIASKSFCFENSIFSNLGIFINKKKIKQGSFRKMRDASPAFFILSI